MDRFQEQNMHNYIYMCVCVLQLPLPILEYVCFSAKTMLAVIPINIRDALWVPFT